MTFLRTNLPSSLFPLKVATFLLSLDTLPTLLNGEFSVVLLISFDTKDFGNSPNDLQISRNTMWLRDLYIDADFLYFLHSLFCIIECNLDMAL